MQRTPVRRFDHYLQVKWLKIAHFTQIQVHRRTIADARGPTGTDHRTMSVVTGEYVAGRRDMRTRLYPLPKRACCTKFSTIFPIILQYFFSDDMIDHGSYTHNVSRWEIKA